MRIRETWIALGLFAAVALGQPAFAQEWRLDESLRTLADEQLDALVDDVRDAPVDALRDVLEEEAAHLEDLHEDEVEEYARQAWARLQAGRENDALLRTIRAELREAGVFSEPLARRIWAEERARLHTFPERTVFHLVERVTKAVLIDRIEAIKRARLEVARIDVDAGDGDGLPDGWPDNQPNERFSWRETGGDATAIDSNLPLPKVTFWSKKASLTEVLYERTYNTTIGDLKVTAAKIEGLARARAGRVEYEDAFGHEVEGLGASFTARAKLTGVRADFRSRDVEAAAGKLNMRAHLNAMAEVASRVEATSTTLLTERGFGTHNEINAGAGARTTASLPIVIDLKVVKLTVIPYATAHAGVSAGAHATLEVEWTGLVRFDVGAHLSTGAGAGAGIVLQIELGPVLRRALEKLVNWIGTFVRPVADALMGRSWRGPSSDSGRLTLTLADLERRWAERPDAPPRPQLGSDAEIAARYAPVLYQRVTRGAFDLLRRVDFDGDWDTTNNWDHTTDGADSSAWVYYDVRETASHYYVTYTLYHSGRFSNAGISPLRRMRRHENDLGGCVVVARKNAPRGREIEAVLSANGTDLRAYSALEETADGEETEWNERHGQWRGAVKFVDEVDHPQFDLERTHPQLWVAGKNHTIYGFTGRDDRRPFSGEDGVVYYPTGTAESPESYTDPSVGYGLRPLSELLEQANNEDAFTTDDLVNGLPRRMRGDEGFNDRAVPPWAWRVTTHEESSSRNDDSTSRDAWIAEGDLFRDPVQALSVLFDLPNDVSRTWTRNPYRPAPAAATGTRGASGEVDSTFSRDGD